jgi:CheY-like chemotaxis protein
MTVSRLDPVTILLVEDNADHAELTKRALEAGNVANDIVWAKDGEEALQYLFHRGPWSDPTSAPRPGLILLDVKLPKVDGHQVLRAVKEHPDLRRIPVVMLTTSERSDEVDDAYRAGANSWVTKPVRFAEFMETIKAVKLYWVLTNRLPS